MPQQLSEPVAIDAVTTKDEFAVWLRSVKDRRGWSLPVLERRSDALVNQDSRRYGPMRRSTSGDVFSGKRLPSVEWLTTFMQLAELPEPIRDEVWAALLRVRAAVGVPPRGAMRVADTSARVLGVHACIRLPGADGDLPEYVPRDVDAQVRAALRPGAFVLLVGSSCSGKTRTLTEALRAQLANWWITRPATPADVSTLVTGGPSQTVVWLDELEHFLDDIGFTNVVGRLMDNGFVLVATMRAQEYRDRNRDDGRPGAAVLRLAEVVDVPSEFSAAELERTRERMVADPRLRVALGSGDFGVTQVLAAGPDLVRQWEQAPARYVWAVITVLVDARRLGVRSPVTAALLAAAVAGLLTPAERAQAPADWLDRALEYACEVLRGAASAAEAVSDGTMGTITGYRAADFLLDHGYGTRRAVCPPDSVWRALTEHLDSADCLVMVARSADMRWRFEHSEALYRKIVTIDAGRGLLSLTDLLARQGRVEEARELLAGAAGAGDERAAARLVRLRLEHGTAADLAALADGRHPVAAVRTVETLAATGDWDALRARATGGDLLAAARLEEREDITGLRRRTGRFARARLAEALGERGDADGAVNVLEELVEEGDVQAPAHLLDLLARTGRFDMIDDRAAAGDEAAQDLLDAHHAGADAEHGGHHVTRYIDVLLTAGNVDAALALVDAHIEAGMTDLGDYTAEIIVAAGHLDQLRALADSGDWPAAHRYARHLADTGQRDELRRRAQDGDYLCRWRLGEVLEADGDLEGALALAQEAADNGEVEGALHLTDLLDATGRVDELAAYSDGQPWEMATWIRHLRTTGRTGDAIAFLRPRARAGNDFAASELAGILDEIGETDEAIAVLRPFTNGWGSGIAVHTLVRLLARHQRVADLRTEIDAGAD
ncbi:hypothetical protein AB0M43_36650 [Longispora sp. NPDC051575]|uniref:tetratricopeptide repeat protein n=1 Tax=Longispora sp. NPDC051575 TaxID=3154943 RepID=UPI0034193648